MKISISFKKQKLWIGIQLTYERAIANRSSTSMICCYVSGEHDYVLLQRGYRNYGKPQVIVDDN